MSSDVPGTVQGILFQPYRALQWLAQAPRGAEVGVEYGDDVSVQSIHGHIYEQDKYTKAKGSRVSNKSIDLWKTLAIWAGKVPTYRTNQTSVEFVLATTKRPRDNALINQLAKLRKDSPTEDVESAVQQVKKIANTTTGDTRTHANKVLSLSDEDLSFLACRIDLEIVHGLTDIKSDIFDHLHLPPSIDTNDAFRSLSGWATETLFNCWEAREPGIITRAALDTFVGNLIRNNLTPAKPTPTYAAYSGISSDELAQLDDENFVKQLRIIEFGDDVILDAMRAFLVEGRERNRLAREGNLTADIITDRDFRLQLRWRRIFRTTAKQTPDKVVAGQQIFDKTIDHVDCYPNIEAAHYLTEGAYHRLANHDPAHEGSVGWHPDYKQQIGKKQP